MCSGGQRRALQWDGGFDPAMTSTNGMDTGHRSVMTKKGNFYIWESTVADWVHALRISLYLTSSTSQLFR
jgi:hypothetical protein